MHNIKIRNCGLLSYGTVQSKWSAYMIWPGPTVSIMMACVDRIKMFLQNIHNHVCTRLYGVLTPTTLPILTTVSTSNAVPNNIKNWNADGNVTLGKLNYRRPVYIFTQYLISHTFPIHCEHCYILCLNTVIYCIWTLLYIASEHCYVLRLNTVIYCIWTLLYIAIEHLYIASEHCYILRLNTVIYYNSKNWGNKPF